VKHTTAPPRHVKALPQTQVTPAARVLNAENEAIAVVSFKEVRFPRLDHRSPAGSPGISRVPPLRAGGPGDTSGAADAKTACAPGAETGGRSCARGAGGPAIRAKTPGGTPNDQVHRARGPTGSTFGQPKSAN
jgi:hypothetical protein